MSHGITHNIANEPMVINVSFHPNVINRNPITIGARIAPTDVEALNNPWPNARSFVGNHSALDFVTPGHGPASPRPSINRNPVRDFIPEAIKVKASAAPQIIADTAKPFLVPILSYNLPEKIWLIPYAIIKKIVMVANTFLV